MDSRVTIRWIVALCFALFGTVRRGPATSEGEFDRMPRIVNKQSVMTMANYNRISVGMTKVEVERLIGGPRRDVIPKDPLWFDVTKFNRGPLPEEWWGPTGIIQVWYQNGKVSKKHFSNHRCTVTVR
jgi:hypothetical protein